MVAFVSSRTGEVLPLEFYVAGSLRQIALPSRVRVNNSDTMADLARLGFGLAQAPRYRFAGDLASGALVEVLADHPPSPTPLSALYPQNRQLALRLRVGNVVCVAVTRPKEEGRIAIVTNAGRAAVDAGDIGAKSFAGRRAVSESVAHTTGVIGVRQNRVVLAPAGWRQVSR